MFGVLDSPEYSGVTAGVYRPIINDGKDEEASLCPSDGSTVDQMHGFNPASLSDAPTGPVQVISPPTGFTTGAGGHTRGYKHAPPGSECMFTILLSLPPFRLPPVSLLPFFFFFIWCAESEMLVQMTVLMG